MYLINVFLNNVIMNSKRTAEDVGPYNHQKIAVICTNIVIINSLISRYFGGVQHDCIHLCKMIVYTLCNMIVYNIKTVEVNQSVAFGGFTF